MPRNALLLVFSNAMFTEMAQLAEAMLTSGRFQPWVLVCGTVKTSVEHVKSWCEQHRVGLLVLNEQQEIQVVLDHGRLKSGTVIEPNDDEEESSIDAGTAACERWLKNSLVRWVLSKSGLDPCKVAKQTDTLYQKLRDAYCAARGVLRVTNSKVVVLPLGNIGLYSLVFPMAARDLNCGSATIPYCLTSRLATLETLRWFPRSRIRAPMTWLMRAWAPRWVAKVGRKNLMRVSLAQILAYRQFGIELPDPWDPVCGTSDVIALENEFMLDFYQTMGGCQIPKMVMTGSLHDDAFAQAEALGLKVRAELDKTFGFLRRHLVVCAIPNDHHDRLTKRAEHCEFSSYEAMVGGWVGNLMNDGRFDVVFRLHPNAPDYVADIVRQHGGVISEKKTLELICASDAFVASVCSTTRWALAAKKPVIDYDVYRFGYPFYERCPEVAMVHTQRGFRNAIADLPVRMDASIVSNKRYGIFDGHSTERVLHLLTLLAEGRPVPYVEPRHPRPMKLPEIVPGQAA